MDWITPERHGERCGRPLRWPLAALLLLLALLCGCSSRQFFYNRLPTILPWYLERYVDLDDAQAARFDEQLERLLQWHREQELPRYAALLEQLQARLDAGSIDAAAVAAISADMERAWYRLRDRALDELLVLGATLSEAQIDEFIAALQKRQGKYERKYLRRTDARYRRDAEEELRDFLQDYLGHLDDEQRGLLVDAAAALQRSDSSWLAERQRWIDTLREELRRETGWEQRIRARISAWEEQIDPASRALYDHNTQVVQEVVAAVLARRDDRQQAKLQRELDALREDILELAAQAATPDSELCAAQFR